MNEAFGLISIICALISYGIYYKHLYSKSIKPHLFSWVIWLTANLVVLVAQYTSGAGAGMWATAVSALCTVGVILLALSNGSFEKQITRSDWLFLCLAFLAIFLWGITGTPLWSIILLIIIDTSAFIPTFRKTYLKPYEENVVLFAINAGKWFFSLLAIESFILINALYPAAMVLTHTLFVIMVVLRRRYSKKA